MPQSFAAGQDNIQTLPETFLDSEFYFFFYVIFISLYFWLCCVLVAACGIQFPDQGLNSGPLHWECRVPVTGSPGKSHRIKALLNFERIIIGSLPDGSAGKEPACSAGDTGDLSSIPGQGGYPGGGNGNPLQYACLKNLMGRGVWWATVQTVAKRQT